MPNDPEDGGRRAEWMIASSVMWCGGWAGDASWEHGRCGGKTRSVGEGSQALVYLVVEVHGRATSEPGAKRGEKETWNGGHHQRQRGKPSRSMKVSIAIKDHGSVRLYLCSERRHT